jgi:hypothetical protein
MHPVYLHVVESAASRFVLIQRIPKGSKATRPCSGTAHAETTQIVQSEHQVPATCAYLHSYTVLSKLEYIRRASLNRVSICTPLRVRTCRLTAETRQRQRWYTVSMTLPGKILLCKISLVLTPLFHVRIGAPISSATSFNCNQSVGSKLLTSRRPVSMVLRIPWASLNSTPRLPHSHGAAGERDYTIRVVFIF